MNRIRLCLDNINNLSQEEVTYLLYQEGKSIKQIAIIRRMSEDEVQKDIIKAKLTYSNIQNKNNSLLIKLLSMVKKDRLEILRALDNEQKNRLKEEIYTNYTKYKSDEDRMILIWLIGELKDVSFLPFLNMELKSKRVNHRRLACSALGKIEEKSTKDWLENALNDDNPQVRQYAIKALAKIADDKSYKLIRNILKNKNEKEYVKKTAVEILNKATASTNNLK